MSEELGWEKMNVEYGVILQRIKVPGGWLYRTGMENAISLCFVPEPDKCCEHNNYVIKICHKCMEERECHQKN